MLQYAAIFVLRYSVVCNFVFCPSLVAAFVNISLFLSLFYNNKVVNK